MWPILLALFIILVSLAMTLFSDKTFISNRWIGGLMPNLHKKNLGRSLTHNQDDPLSSFGVVHKLRWQDEVGEKCQRYDYAGFPLTYQSSYILKRPQIFLRNLHLFLTGTSANQKKAEILQNFCGLLRIYELYIERM